MRKVTSINKLALFFILFLAVSFGVKAQHGNQINVNYIFSSDSLVGFDESAAQQAAFNIGAYGEEFKVYMHVEKRQFIDAKYNLIKPVKEEKYVYSNSSSNNKGPTYPNVLVANCNNEDFEAATGTSPTTVTIVTPLAVLGWTINGGSNSSWGATGNCTNTGSLITGNPSAVVLINPGAAGHLDPIIGASYRIWSVYGNTTTSYPAATTANGFQCYGDWFIKLNNQTAGSSVQKMSKCIDVTSSNALFQFAFISVLQGAHCCCDNGSIRLRVLTGGFGSSCATTPVSAYTQTSCPSFTAASNSSGSCGSQPGGNNAVCTSTGNTTSYLPTAVGGWSYNRWKQVTLDLTSFIGQSIRLEAMAMDCPYSGHAGYVFFDAQCSPMDVCTNLGCYPAGTASITVPTCGAGSTATITAPPITGGYTWTTPGSYTIAPGSGGQTIYTGTTGDHTLTMNPPGSCSPIIRYINVVIAPSPNLILNNAINYSCSNTTLNGITVSGSSGSPGPGTPTVNVSFLPAQPTGTTGVSVNSGTYTGLATGVNTITITDGVGCTATQTVFVTPLVPVPTLTFNTPNGTVLGCNPPSVPLIAVNTSTDPLLAGATYTYNWAGASTSSVNTATFNATAPGNYTVSATATYTTPGGPAISCITTSVIAVTGSTLIPTISVAPATRTLNCSGNCQTFTASTTSGTANIIGNWYAPGPSTIVGPTGSPMLMCANAPGTYTAEFCSTISGCCTTQTVAVFPAAGMPTLSVTVSSFNGFTINCTNPRVIMNTNTSSLTGPFGYTWTPLPSPPGTPVASSVGGYTANVPGQYEIKFLDGNLCPVSSTVNIYIDTLRPSPLAITNLPSNSFTLNCYNDTLISTAITTPLFASSNYSWTIPGPLTSPSNTIQVTLAQVTSSTAPTVYTVSAMGANGCVGRARVNFYKDIFMPTYSPAFTPSLGITCGNPCVAMTPTTSSAITPINFTFTSPPPTQTATTAGALMCVPGPYTMVYQNIANGCTRTGTVNVPQNVTPPAVVPQAPIYLPCGVTTTIVSAGTTTTSTTYSYTWDGPAGSLMSCLGGTACNTSSVNMSGIYSVFIYNSLNGCSTTNSVLVVDGQITASISADPSSGFSPLNVNFTNSSQLGAVPNSTNSTSVWSYGNGLTSVITGSNPLAGVSTIYQSAGSYTVLLIITQVAGTSTCVGTASTVVNVDLPSSLSIPNVFTPNGDGVNDVFMLQTVNITEVNCQIFDRWGVKMYDVNSEKGNISWDGKNLGKKEVPAGTYFYILTAKGLDGKDTWNDKDGKEIPKKGTISLYR
jgi:gliding motility-associated-like protein